MRTKQVIGQIALTLPAMMIVLASPVLAKDRAPATAGAFGERANRPIQRLEARVAFIATGCAIGGQTAQANDFGGFVADIDLPVAEPAVQLEWVCTFLDTTTQVERDIRMPAIPYLLPKTPAPRHSMFAALLRRPPPRAIAVYSPLVTLVAPSQFQEAADLDRARVFARIGWNDMRAALRAVCADTNPACAPAWLDELQSADLAEIERQLGIAKAAIIEAERARNSKAERILDAPIVPVD
ncbi:MAG TPA: hypothetical protein DCZ49_03495 [Hyphomonadaceae bacterium]|nr:hypothetical protein [Hyphomonadaceae bacterium]